MKADIHPQYPNSQIRCACGAVFDTRTTRGNYSIEICSQCHPHYTGKQKLMDTEGRVDRFNRKYKRPTAKQPAGAEAPKA